MSDVINNPLLSSSPAIDGKKPDYISPPQSTALAANPRWYISSVPSCGMIREDGKRIVFQFGSFLAEYTADQTYLNKAIDEGVPFIRYATEEEVYALRMAKDPRGVITAEVEAELREKLTAEILAEQAAKDDGIKLAAVDPVMAAGQAIQSGDATVVMASVAAPLKGISGTNADLAGPSDTAGVSTSGLSSKL